MSDLVVKKIKKYSITLAIIAMLVMVTLVVMEVVSRSLFAYSFKIINELNGYFMTTIIFLGMVSSFDAGSFVRVEFVYERFSEGFRKIADIICNVIMFLYIVIMGYYAIKMNIVSYEMGSKSFGFLQIYIWFPQLLLSIGFILFAIYLIITTAKMITRRSN